jgi:hypothetical protein
LAKIFPDSCSFQDLWSTHFFKGKKHVPKNRLLSMITKIVTRLFTYEFANWICDTWDSGINNEPSQYFSI